MTFKHGALLVVGSGPGIGQNVANVFAERGFEKVILLSRNKDRLPKDAEAVRSSCSSVKVDEIVADCADAESVRKALEAADKSLGQTPLECILYNSARPGSSDFFDFPAETLTADLQVSCSSWSSLQACPKSDTLYRYASSACTPLPSGQCPSSSN